jgi:putative flavoprotein involved in K+ transport
VLTVQTPIGRKVRPKALTATAPLERVRPKELAAAGVERVPRTVGSQDGFPVLEDGRVMDVATVIWCTGFRPDFAWIDLPVLGQDGAPANHRGVVGSQPGLYLIGLWVLSRFTSSLLGGVGSDAEHIAGQIASHRPDGQRWAAASRQSNRSRYVRQDRDPAKNAASAPIATPCTQRQQAHPAAT